MLRLKRPIGLALLIILAGIFAAGCGSAPKEPGRYYCDTWEYSIKFPAGWELEETYDGAVVSAYSPLEDDYDMLFESVTVSVDDMIFGVDLDEYYSAVQRSARTDFLYFNEERCEDITLHTTRAKKTVFTYQEEGEMVKTLGYCFVKGSKAFLITCVSEEYTYPEYVAAFEQAAESFRFE